MSSFAEFCIMALIIIMITEIYTAFNDLSLKESYSSFSIGYFFNVAINGILLALNEYVFMKYLKKVVLKKQLAFDHDFVGLWLEITNIVIAFCLAAVHVSGAEFNKNHNPYLSNLGTLPTFRYLQILCSI